MQILKEIKGFSFHKALKGCSLPKYKNNLFLNDIAFWSFQTHAVGNIFPKDCRQSYEYLEN